MCIYNEYLCKICMRERNVCFYNTNARWTYNIETKERSGWCLLDSLQPASYLVSTGTYTFILFLRFSSFLNSIDPHLLWLGVRASTAVNEVSRVQTANGCRGVDDTVSNTLLLNTEALHDVFCLRYYYTYWTDFSSCVLFLIKSADNIFFLRSWTRIRWRSVSCKEVKFVV